MQRGIDLDADHRGDRSALPEDASKKATRRVSLFGWTRREIAEWLASWGEPAYRADQLHQWLYHKRVDDFARMTNLPKALRSALSERAVIRWPRLVRRVESSLDDTVKYLFELEDGERVESVLMRDGDRVTLCLSSQVGCRQGCTFCATAQLGLRRNMTPGEIIGQVVRVEEEVGVGAITNLVFMGMGEPLANYGNLMAALEILSAPDGLAIAARKITVSTSGLVPAIDRFTREGLKVGLALSLNATTNEVRDRLIPSNRRYTIAGVLDACRRWARATGRRVTIEYVLMKGVNDSVEDARRLLSLLRGIPAKVNLIPFNEVPGGPFERPDDARVAAFQRVLMDAYLVTTVRKTKGRDIAAACGQLRAEDGADLVPIVSSAGGR